MSDEDSSGRRALEKKIDHVVWQLEQDDKDRADRAAAVADNATQIAEHEKAITFWRGVVAAVAAVGTLVSGALAFWVSSLSGLSSRVSDMRAKQEAHVEAFVEEKANTSEKHLRLRESIREHRHEGSK